MKTILRRILGFILFVTFAICGATAFPVMVVFTGIDNTIDKLDDLMDYPAKMVE